MDDVGKASFTAWGMQVKVEHYLHSKVGMVRKKKVPLKYPDIF